MPLSVFHKPIPTRKTAKPRISVINYKTHRRLALFVLRLRSGGAAAVFITRRCLFLFKQTSSFLLIFHQQLHLLNSSLVWFNTKPEFHYPSQLWLVARCRILLLSQTYLHTGTSRISIEVPRNPTDVLLRLPIQAMLIMFLAQVIKRWRALHIIPKTIRKCTLFLSNTIYWAG